MAEMSCREGDNNRRGNHEQAAGHTPAPDVSTGLWPSESGIPADPLAAPVSSDSRSRRGWSSNVTPRMNPIVIARMNPQWQSLSAQIIFISTTHRHIGLSQLQ